MKKHKKYVVDYTSGATGFGWKEEYDNLSEFESFINEMRSVYTVRLIVWDDKLQDFIFWKDSLTYKPSTDMLGSPNRDMRTKTKQRK